MKTMGEIYARIDALVGEKKSVGEISHTLRRELIEYYEGEGRELLENSPHRGVSVAGAVELLMQEVSGLIQKKVKERRERLKG